MNPVQLNTVLLVEDNPDDEALTLRALRKNHVANEVVVVRDGAQALDWLYADGDCADRDPKEIPHLVLLDLNLPKVDGLEVLAKIRANPRTRFLPVVVLTSSDEERDVVESYELGANSFIRKPVDFEQFADAIRTLGLYWLVFNQTPPEPREVETE